MEIHVLSYIVDMYMKLLITENPECFQREQKHHA
jgi:hypothetical protein